MKKVKITHVKCDGFQKAVIKPYSYKYYEVEGKPYSYGGFDFVIFSEDRIYEVFEVTTGASVTTSYSKSPKRDVLEFVHEKVDSGKMQTAIDNFIAAINKQRKELEDALAEIPNFPLNRFEQ